MGKSSGGGRLILSSGLQRCIRVAYPPYSLTHMHTYTCTAIRIRCDKSKWSWSPLSKQVTGTHTSSVCLLITIYSSSSVVGEYSRVCKRNHVIDGVQGGGMDVVTGVMWCAYLWGSRSLAYECLLITYRWRAFMGSVWYNFPIRVSLCWDCLSLV